jgi:hypothetical protein
LAGALIILFGRDSSIVIFTVDDGATAAVAAVTVAVAAVISEVAVDFTDFAALVEVSAAGDLIFT